MYHKPAGILRTIDDDIFDNKETAKNARFKEPLTIPITPLVDNIL